MSDSNKQQDLGHLFQQQRRNHAATAKPPKQLPPSQKPFEDHPPKKGSLLDIQAEQERERASARNHHPRSAPLPSSTGPPRRKDDGGSSHASRQTSSRSPNRRRPYEFNNNTVNHSTSLDGFNNNRGNNNNSWTINSRGGRPSHHRRGGGSSYDQLPLEQGVICTLKESFGFIYCADRPDEMFFHFSELIGCRADDIHVDDEVEFRVLEQIQQQSSRTDSTSPTTNDKKVSAVQIRVLDKGTIVWEIVENQSVRHQGIVERPARGGAGAATVTSSSPNSAMDGSIRLLVDETDGNQHHLKPTGLDNHTNIATKLSTTTDDQKLTSSTTSTATSNMLRFRFHDYQPSSHKNDSDKSSPSGGGGGGATSASSSSPLQRLGRGDVVEFAIVTDRRTQQKYARDIVLLQSERERVRLAREQEWLSTATAEQGVITSLKSDYGFLRSNRRKEQVYFHISHLVDTGGITDDTTTTTAPAASEEDLTGGNNTTINSDIIQEGQDVSFLVVVESSGDDGQKRRISAREVQPLPRGSVVFTNTLAMGVTGVVTRCPQPIDSGHDDEVAGTIRLLQPLHDHVDNHVASGGGGGGEEPRNHVVVTEVTLSARDSPGGNFSYRSGAAVGLWIRDGDILLFDVIKDLADGTYRAAPTQHLEPLAKWDDDDDDDGKRDNDRQQQPSGENDADGAVVMNSQSSTSFPAAIRLVRMSLVSRAEGIIRAIKDNYGFIHYSERAVDVHFRIFEVLPEELQVDLRRNMGFSPLAASHKMSPRLRLEVGTEVQFDLSLHGKVASASSGGGNKGRSGKPHERENLKGQRVVFLPPGTVKFEKVLAAKVQGVVTKEDPKQPFVGVIALEKEIEPMTADDRYPLVAKMLDEFLKSIQPSIIYPDLLSVKESDIISGMALSKGQGSLECSFIPFASDLSHPGRLCIRKISSTVPSTSEDSGSPCNPEKVTGTSYDRDNTSDMPSNPDIVKLTPSKKKGQVVKTVRYDKHSLVEAVKDGMPPCEGDIVVCDVVQSRKTGQILLANVKIVERKSVDVVEDELARDNGVGIVKEVSQSRQYGFIAVSDESSTKPDLLFFHMADVQYPSGGNYGNPLRPQQKQSNQLHSGDEVKFDFGVEKNGKKIAKNVRLIAKGSTPGNSNKTDKHACRGYILMVPSHTTIVNTASTTTLKHSGSSSSATGSGSRWDNVKEDTKSSSLSSAQTITGLGRILLLDDPTHVFGSNATPVSTKNDDEREQVTENPDTPTKITLNEGGNYIKQARPQGWMAGIGSHLFYTSTAITSTADGSTTPRRGDLVSFHKVRNGNGIRDVRVIASTAAALVKGRLEKIERPSPPPQDTTDETPWQGTANFIVNSSNQGKIMEDEEETYPVDLLQVISCHPSLLKEKEPVEGILHDDKIYGICRICDIHLESKLGSSHRERPRLNLTVRKDRAGTIMAQSMMAKGPDGTNGFVAGWTNRISVLAMNPDYAELRLGPAVTTALEEVIVEPQDVEE